MRLIVVRHYKTEINARQQIMGWGDSVPVQGWEADMLAVCEMLGKTDLHFDAIYTSKLTRARVTGEFYAGQLGVEQLDSDAALNEVNYGSLFKKSKQWVSENVPEYKRDPEFVFPGGESFRQMQRRSVAFVNQLVSSRPEQNLLMVVHAGVVRGLICHYLDLPYADNLNRHISHRYIGDFLFEDGRCTRYDELGSRSDFVANGVIGTPCVPN